MSYKLVKDINEDLSINQSQWSFAGASSSSLRNIDTIINNSGTKQPLSPLTAENLKQLTHVKEKCGEDHHVEFGSHYTPSKYGDGGTSPIHSAIFNMLAGCGIVGLPITFRNSGLVVGIVLMIFIAIISVYTLRLLVKAAKKVQVEDYERLCEVCFGRSGYYLLSFSILIFDIGACLTYSIIMGDSARDVFSQLFGWDKFYQRQIFVTIIYVVFILPFCLGKSFTFIEKVSGIAIFSVVIMISIVIKEYWQNYFPSDIHKMFDNVKLINYNSTQILSALGTISFAFVQHDQTFMVYRTLENNTLKRYTILASFALGIQCILCCNIGFFGYLSFGNSTQDDVLENYPNNNHIMIAVRVLYTFTLAFIYPTAFYVVRHISYSIVYRKENSLYDNASCTRKIVFTLVPWALFLITSLFVTDLGFVMALSGLIAALMIAFILPCLCYLKVTKYPWRFWNAPSGKKYYAFIDTFPCIVLIIFGVACGSIGTVQVIMAEF